MKITKYLHASPVFAINTAYEAIVPKLNQKLKAEKLNLLQGLVLTALFFEGENDIGPSQLADLFQTSRGNMSHIISHLEAMGWVKRVLNPNDARGFKIELKAEGRRKALGLIKFYDAIQDQLETKLGVAACQKTVENLRAMTAVVRSR